jgi:hypothetical protein
MLVNQARFRTDIEALNEDAQKIMSHIFLLVKSGVAEPKLTATPRLDHGYQGTSLAGPGERCVASG